jgi:hypothetical protein
MKSIINLRNFIILIIILLIGFILYANFTIPPFITSVSDVDSLVEEDKRIVKVFTSNYFYKFNKTTYCLLLTDGSLPTVNDKGWIKANNGYCSFVIGDGDYDVYVKDKYGNISDVNKKKVKVPKKEKLIQEVDMNHGTVYLYPGKTFTVAPKNEYSEQLVWESEDASIASVSEGRITGNIYGKTKVKVHIGEDKFAQVDVVVTNLIKQPNPFVKKEYVTCNQFTNGQAAMIDSILESRVNDAGYGTRAGVVEAARFLVGALDYKVPYLGPKKDDSSLGRYSKIGLNIGKKGAWGCLVSGWIQGMDCTNFVSWAFYQNGISMHPYSNNHFNIREVIDQIKVGDLLYSPCVSTCKNDYKLSHVGIIIGIDDNYFYVAESTTGNINAIIVSKLDKRNLPEKDKFSRVNLYQYSSEGNVTNMWVQ